jgi:hypothetical protein
MIAAKQQADRKEDSMLVITAEGLSVWRKREYVEPVMKLARFSRS